MVISTGIIILFIMYIGNHILAEMGDETAKRRCEKDDNGCVWFIVIVMFILMMLCSLIVNILGH